MNRIDTLTIPELLRLLATLTWCLVALLLVGIVGCKCPPAELADERTPTSAVECYDQAFEVGRDCRSGFVEAGSSQSQQAACVEVLGAALTLCDRHYGQPYHNGKTPAYLGAPAENHDTETGADDAL